jgi:hypothetical protein
VYYSSIFIKHLLVIKFSVSYHPKAKCENAKKLSRDYIYNNNVSKQMKVTCVNVTAITVAGYFK